MVRVPGGVCCYREADGEGVLVSASGGGRAPREGTPEGQYARPTSQEGYSQGTARARGQGILHICEQCTSRNKLR